MTQGAKERQTPRFTALMTHAAPHEVRSRWVLRSGTWYPRKSLGWYGLPSIATVPDPEKQVSLWSGNTRPVLRLADYTGIRLNGFHYPFSSNVLRKLSCFSERRIPGSTFSLRAVLVWMVIFAASLASGVYVVRNYLERARAHRADENGMSALEILPVSKLWELFSIERKIFLAGALTLLLEYIPSLVRVRRGHQVANFGRTLSRPPIRRFWYRFNQRRPPRAITVPCVVASAYLVTFIMVRMVLFALLYPQFTEAFFTDVDSAGMSLSRMLHLVNLALLTYLVVSLFDNLLRTPTGTRQERFLLIFAMTVLGTSRYTVY